MAGWTTARPVIVAFLEAATPAAQSAPQGLGDSFVHDVAVSDDVVGAFRHFGLILRGGPGRRGPAQIVASYAIYDVDLVVDYPASDDAAAIDVAIGADFEVLAAALCAQANWQPESTTAIRFIGADALAGSDTEFRFEAVPVAGGRRLVISFQVEVLT